MSSTAWTIFWWTGLALGLAIVAVIGRRARRAAAADHAAAEEPREHPIRRALVFLPLALALLNTAGATAVFWPVEFVGVLMVLIVMAVFAVVLCIVLEAASPVLPLPDFIGLASGSLVASHTMLWWALIEAGRSGDAQSGLVMIFGPYYALAAAPFGAALGWLIGAAYRRLALPRTI